MKDLRDEYYKLRKPCSGKPLSTDIVVDSELVSNLKRSKAADIDGLSSEHLLF